MKTLTCLLLVSILVATSGSARADDQRTDPDRTEDATLRPRHSDSARPMRALPITMLVLGGAAIVGGAVAIAFDQDPVATRPVTSSPSSITTRPRRA